jgi:aminotransferase in exopolysaccharide biosynthesis
MIPLSIPNLSGKELDYLSECIKTGWISSAGKFVNDFEEQISEYTNTNHAIACMNGTVGLQTALNILGVSNKDLVLTTNLTFVATLNAISYTGAQPILFDIDESTWQIDLDLVEEWILENTLIKENLGKLNSYNKKTNQRIGAIIPVHVLGGLVDIGRLLYISKKYHIPIVEDSTEALGSSFKGRLAGSFGQIGVFSFNGNKIISTGGGGMIVTNDKNLGEKAKHITTTAKTDPLNYYHDEIGYNYRLVNVLAAIGVAQMEQLPRILENKKRIDSNYRNELNEINNIVFQEHIRDSDPNCWLFTFRSPKMRKLLNYLNSNNIQSRPFWTPMNRLPMYSILEYVTKQDVTGKIFSECISIPSSSNLTEGQQEEVINTIKKFHQK